MGRREEGTREEGREQGPGVGAEEEGREQGRGGGGRRREGGKEEKERKEVFLQVSVYFLSGDITT